MAAFEKYFPHRKITVPLHFSAILVILFAGGAQAGEQGEVAGEFIPTLFLSQHPSAHEKGELSVAAAGQYFGSRPGQDTDFAFALEYGLTDRLTLELDVPYLLTHPAADARVNGFGDIGVNALYNFFRSPDTLLSVYGQLHLPTGSRNGDLGSGNIEVEASVLLAHRFGDFFELDASIGGVFAFNEDAELSYSIAVSKQIGPFFPVLELSGLSGANKPVYLTPGVVWKHDVWEVAFGIPVGLTDDAAPWGLILEVTYSFP